MLLLLVWSICLMTECAVCSRWRMRVLRAFQKGCFNEPQIMKCYFRTWQSGCSLGKSCELAIYFSNLENKLFWYDIVDNTWLAYPLINLGACVFLTGEKECLGLFVVWCNVGNASCRLGIKALLKLTIIWHVQPVEIYTILCYIHIRSLYISKIFFKSLWK